MTQPRLTWAQSRGMAVRVARASRRWAIIRTCSDEGTTIDEAARRAGLTVGGVKSQLMRHGYSRAWPMQKRAAL